VKVPEQSARAILPQVREAAALASRVTGLIEHPLGHKPEELEDALNALQEAGFQARTAYGRERGRITEANR
jgi:hypothetical protein